MLERIEALLSKINEKSFIESLLKYYNKKGYLTEAQMKYFERMENMHSPESMEEDRLFKIKYKSDPDMQENAFIASLYYSNLNGYYDKLANRILNDEYIPTQSEYTKLTENKYSKRIIEETKRSPLFNNGDIVQIRKTCWEINYEEPIRNKHGMVIDLSNEPVLEVHQGAKKYNVLLFGTTSPLTIEERWLKRARNKK